MIIGNLEVYGIIYKITNKKNNKVYIGQTCQEGGFYSRYCYKGNTDIERVYKYHLSSKNVNNGSSNTHLLNSIEKYDFENFEVSKIFDVAFSKEELDLKEISWINIYNSTNSNYGYNHRHGGAKGKANKTMIEEASKRILGFDINNYKEEIVSKYNNGENAEQISNNLSVSITNTTLLKYLRLWGFKIKTHSELLLGFNIENYEEDIIKDYLNIKILQEVANKYNVDVNVIKRILSKNNINLFNHNEIKIGKNLEDYKEEILQMYVTPRCSIIDIAKKYDVDDTTLRRKIKQWNVSTKTLSEVKLGYNINDYENDIIYYYKEMKMNLTQISKKFNNVHTDVIKKILKKNNIYINNNSEIMLGFDIEAYKEEIIDLYSNKKYSTNKISKYYDNKIGTKTINKWLKKWNIPIRNNSECKIGCCNGKENYNSIKITLIDINENKEEKFDCIRECADWMIKNNISKTINTAKDAINTSIRLKRPYKKRYSFIKEK